MNENQKPSRSSINGLQGMGNCLRGLHILYLILSNGKKDSKSLAQNKQDGAKFDEVCVPAGKQIVKHLQAS